MVIFDSKPSGKLDANGVMLQIVSGQVDDSTDLPDDVAEGSKFYAAQEGKTYYLDSAGTWYDNSGNAVSSS